MKLLFHALNLSFIMVLGIHADGGCTGVPNNHLSPSVASVLDVDPAFIFQNKIPYISYRSTDFQVDPSFVIISRFKLTDGDGITPDADTTPTVLESVTFSITNPANIRRIALYDQTNTVIPGTEQNLNGAPTITFTSLSAVLTASDDNAITFTVRVSFQDVVVDHDLIRLNITSALANTGSQFNDVPPTLIGGVPGGAITPANRNVIDVVATQLIFAPQPPSSAGINQPTPQPKVLAIDAGGNLDYDAGAAAVTSAVGIVNAPAVFVNGQLNFANLRYTSTGNGTLTVSVSSPAGVPPVKSSQVDVIHMTGTAATGGLVSSTELSSGSAGNVIFGFTLDVPYSVPAGPKLNEFTIGFGNPFIGILTNIHVYASLDETLNRLVDKDITPFVSLIPAGDSLRVVLNTGDGWDDFLKPRPGFGITYDIVTNSKHLSYFIEADIAPNANFTVAPITPSVKRLAYNGSTSSHIVMTMGSSLVNVTGPTYTFKDVTKPELSATIPFVGQLNQTSAADIVLTFSEPVKAMDGKIQIFDARLRTFVAELVTIDPLGTFRTSFTFPTTYIDPVTTLVTNYFSPDTRYYITIAGVNANATQGFIDTSGNDYDGIANYSFNFKTSSILPPVVTNNAVFSDISLRGGTLGIGTDQPGDVFYMIVANPSTVPLSIAEIKGSATYTGGAVISRGSLPIVQPNVYQFGLVTASFINNAKYDIYMYAQNDATPPVVTGVLPSVTFVAKDPLGSGAILQAPSINICPGGFIKVFSPISVLERSIDDFQNKDGDLILALPTGFVFNTAIQPVLTTVGSDFTGPDTIQFINNTLLRVTFKNTAASSFDRLTISGLQIKAITTTGTGKIIKLAGSALPFITNAAAWATLAIKGRSPVDFSNNENGSKFFSDKANNVLLIPDPSDFGPNVFSGPGIIANSDSLYIRLAGLGVHDISLIHTYEDGCVVTKTNLYTIFESNNAIAGIDKAQYCAGEPSTQVRYDGRAASLTAPYYLKSLSVDLPATVLTDSIQLLGKYYRSLVKSCLTKTDSVLIDGIMCRSYQFNPGVFNTKELQALFRPVDGGGLLGEIEFQSVYVSGLTLKESPLPLKVKIYVSPKPVISTDALGLNPAFPNQYCEELGTIKFTAIPPPALGQRTGAFQLSLFNPLTHTYMPVSGVGVLTDLNNGTAILDTKAARQMYGYDSMKVDYQVHSLSSLCDGTISTTFRITPNPRADFTVSSAACEGVDLKFRNASDISLAKPDFAISEWKWNFDDPNYFTPANPDIVIGNLPAAVDPVHRYVKATAGGYHPSLVVKSNYGCLSTPKTISITVGGVPVVAYTYSGVTAPITLTDASTVFEPNGIDSTDFYYRKILLTPAVAAQDTAFTHLASTVVFGPPPGTYDLKLRVKSKLGCVNTLSRKVVVLEYKTVTNSSPYVEKFETGDGGWQVMPDSTKASWRVGNPGTQKTVIKKDPVINGNAFWFTGRKAPYHAKEKSYLYSNAYDISLLDRPLITFNSFVQMEQSDGVVLQYSLDNKNVADTTKTWTALGSYQQGISSGADWYNALGLASKPGNQLSKDYGWTGSAGTQWNESRHSLDTLKGQHLVVFRFALSSVNSNPRLDGFGVDNVRIGNRTRTVLLESFFNTGNTTVVNGKMVEKVESDEVRAFNSAALGIEIIKLNYHIGFPQVDPINSDNPAVPSSRALFYNVAKTPASVLDGRGAIDKNQPYFSQWGQRQFQLRSLKLGQADISVMPVAGHTTFTDKGMVALDVDVKAIEALPTTTVLHVGVVEQMIILPPSKQGMVKTGEPDFAYVVKELLPSAAGTKFTTPLRAQSTTHFGPFKWTTVQGRLYNSPGVTDLSIVVFLQNEDTREIYQAVMVTNLSDPDPALVTALEPGEPEDILVYPNPADGEFTVLLPSAAPRERPMSLIDAVGTSLDIGEFAPGQRQKTINAQSLSTGLYILQVGFGERVVRKRVMVMHR